LLEAAFFLVAMTQRRCRRPYQLTSLSHPHNNNNHYIMKFAIASSALLLLASSTNAFAPATFGSSFVQSRVAFAPVVSSSSALQMNLFDRFTRVAKSNLNNILKNLEDPEKIMNQAVEDMQVC
jgi:hypothetical protein